MHIQLNNAWILLAYLQCNESRAHCSQSTEKGRHCQKVKRVKWAQLPSPVPCVPHPCWMPPTVYILLGNCWQYWGKLMTCALHRLVPAKHLMHFLLMLVLQQEGKCFGWESVCSKQLLCASTIPQEGVCNTGLQGLESTRLLLSPFCFFLSMSDDWGCSEDAVLPLLQSSHLFCQPLPYLVCVTREVFRAGNEISPASRAEEIQERT